MINIPKSEEEISVGLLDVIDLAVGIRRPIRIKLQCRRFQLVHQGSFLANLNNLFNSPLNVGAFK